MIIKSHKTLTYKILRNLIGFFCVYFLSFHAAAQKRYFLQVETSENLMQDSLSRVYSDSFSLKAALFTWQQAAFAKSFFEASVDKLERKDTIFKANLHLGKAYQWLYLDKGNVENYILSKVGFRQKMFEKKPLNILELKILQEKIVNYLENQGYPFTSIRLDSLDIQPFGVRGKLKLKKGEKIYFDGIQLEDDSVKIGTRYLENYLGVSPKKIYEQEIVKNINLRLRELPFLSLEGEPYLTFTGNAAKVNLLLKKKKASRFDAVLGLLPSSSTNGEQRNFGVTGTLNLDLQNLAGKGERFFVDFQRLRTATQELKTQLTYPYLFNYNIGIDASLNIYKDSIFTDVKINTGLQYLFSGNNYIKIYWAQNKNNLGLIDSIEKTQIIQSKRLERLDFDANAYGLEIAKQHLDYRFNPRKGWQIQAKSDIGTRIIRKNNDVVNIKDPNNLNFSFESLYDSLTLRTLRLQANMTFDYYIPILKQSTLKIGLQAAGLFTEKPIYQNEQYRIGGNRVLRGFNEASIYATRYALLTLEYRFLFGQNSYFNLFADGAYLENKTVKTTIIERPLGIGAGMTFETRAGLFSIVYALGKPHKNSFDARNGKIHFGYVSLF
jgi:hypothetical protein